MDSKKIDRTNVSHFSKILKHFQDKNGKIWFLRVPVYPLINMAGQNYLYQIHCFEETFLVMNNVNQYLAQKTGE